ncbi:MAG: TlpA disulfide reductase family protein [Candidatus Poseidoniaceae archaeon]|jgi:hypothetical protein|nr:TlpA disulfide reductase family protein [Candidatus Poseidoniaceae archaeon]
MHEITDCNEAGARTDATMVVMSIFIAAFMLIAWTTDPVYQGVSVDDRAPPIEGKIFKNNVWMEWSLEDQLDETWISGSAYGTWHMIEFMDIYCGHCQSAAPEVRDQYNNWRATDLPGEQEIEFVAVSIALWQGDPSRDYSRENIESFRNDSGQTFPYIDDLDNSNRDVWAIPGTPTYFLIAPNGQIVYASPEAAGGETVYEAMNRIIMTQDVA